MDDDIDDYEMFLSTIRSHFSLLCKSVVNLTQILISLNWTTISYYCDSIQVYVMKPQTFAFVTLILLLALICHTFEFWFKYFTRSTIKFAKRLNVGLSLVSTAVTSLIPNVECLSGISNDNIVNELKDNLVGVYALQGRRPKMEDKFTYINDSLKLGIEYWAVFDGHGGDSAAIYVESNLYNSISKRVEELVNRRRKQDYCEKSSEDYCNNSVNDSVDQHMMRECTDSKSKSSSHSENKFEALNVATLSQIVTEEVLEIDKQFIIESKKNLDVAGSTALIALRIVEQNKLIVANVGDSRGVICDAKGAAIPLSFDHKPQQLKEHKRIKEAGGFIKFNGVWRVAGILATSRAMGDYPLKETNFVIAEPDILTFDLNDMQPKFMILASDGLWDTFSNEEAVSFVKENLNKVRKSNSSQIAYEVAKKLALESYKRGSLDNVTVVLVVFDANCDDISHSSTLNSPSN